MKLTSICIAVAAMTPMFASALTPGQYNVGDIQQICLVAGGTWYGTTFPAWGGAWVTRGGMRGGKTYIFGNYAEGVGNDSMVFTGHNNRGPWTEWRDDLSFMNPNGDVLITFVKSKCDPPPASAGRQDGNPADGQ